MHTNYTMTQSSYDLLTVVQGDLEGISLSDGNKFETVSMVNKNI